MMFTVMLNSRLIRAATRTQTSARSFVTTPSNNIRAIVSDDVKISKLRPYPSLASDRPFMPRTTSLQIRTNFSYAGPRKLGDILKIDQIKDKPKVDIEDLWMTYHEGKEKVHGLVLDGGVGKSVLARAAQCPFFIHPVFRDGGHFMIVSQFQPPNHFLLALLEDYKMDPSRAQPLLTLSVFDDLVESKDLALVRCDIINNGIEDDEGYKLSKCLIADYSEEEAFTKVHMFNKMPDKFDVDSVVSEKKDVWMADA